jgi:hypothetical protein
VTSRTNQDRDLAAFAAVPDQESLTAKFVSQTGAVATVIQGNNVIQVRSQSQYPVISGDNVRLERRDGNVVMMGPTKPRSATGRVTATGSPMCTVEYPSGSGVTTQAPYNPVYTPAVNDAVQLSWDMNGASIVNKLTAIPGTVAPPTPPPAGVQIVQQIFAAIDSGSYSGGWKKTDVWSTDSWLGAWFYGSTIKDTIPDGAPILAARLYLPAKTVSGNPPNLGVHGSPTKPGGAVAISSAAALGGRSGWVDVPLGLIDFLKVNDGGLGFNHGGYNIFAGVASDGSSGALDITYAA